jgi:predicted NBD/HSP70 family sugar kinase
LSREDFSGSIRGVFHALRKEWGGIPFEVANDGDVAALAGAMAIGSNGVLGLSMGTSQAAGFIDRKGTITNWINELAFAPVEYRADAPADEWSGDIGCGVQYFSQQAVGRLLPRSGLEISTGAPLAERLESVQAFLARGDERAGRIFQTIGTWLGYAIFHYKEFYDFDHLLLLGRVLSGEGGRLLATECQAVLRDSSLGAMEGIRVHVPDEATIRHGQAVAAASLPFIPPITG